MKRINKAFEVGKFGVRLRNGIWRGNSWVISVNGINDRDAGNIRYFIAESINDALKMAREKLVEMFAKAYQVAAAHRGQGWDSCDFESSYSGWYDWLGGMYFNADFKGNGTMIVHCPALGVKRSVRVKTCAGDTLPLCGVAAREILDDYTGKLQSVLSKLYSMDELWGIGQ